MRRVVYTLKGSITFKKRLHIFYTHKRVLMGDRAFSKLLPKQLFMHNSHIQAENQSENMHVCKKQN